MNNPLLKELIELTELPTESIEKELLTILSKSDLSPEQVSLEVLREAMVLYLQQTMLEVKQQSEDLSL